MTNCDFPELSVERAKVNIKFLRTRMYGMTIDAVASKLNVSSSTWKTYEDLNNPAFPKAAKLWEFLALTGCMTFPAHIVLTRDLSRLGINALVAMGLLFQTIIQLNDEAMGVWINHAWARLRYEVMILGDTQMLDKVAALEREANSIVGRCDNSYTPVKK